MKKRKRRKIFVVSVKDFGAIGDGIADDTEAFDAARRSLAHIIKVPPGQYEVGTELDDRFVATKRG